MLSLSLFVRWFNISGVWTGTVRNTHAYRWNWSLIITQSVNCRSFFLSFLSIFLSSHLWKINVHVSNTHKRDQFFCFQLDKREQKKNEEKKMKFKLNLPFFTRKNQIKIWSEIHKILFFVETQKINTNKIA